MSVIFDCHAWEWACVPGTNFLQTKDGPEYLNHTSPPPSLAESSSSDQVFPCLLE